MHERPDGDFGVAPSESITVTVRKAIAPYAAAISDLIHSTWDSVLQPDDKTEVRSFHAPSTKSGMASLGIFFDFPPDASGSYDPSDKYTVELKGESGPGVTRTIFPPPPAQRTYTFVVE